MSVDKIVELRERGFCVLKTHFPKSLVEAVREALWPLLLDHLEKHRDQPNRGPHRYFLAMPFKRPCFAPEFFFDTEVLRIVRSLMDGRVVADQWSCDVPIRGSVHQQVHIDYQRPLFPEAPELLLPAFMLVVSFGLINITSDQGPIEIAPGTHRLPRDEAGRLIEPADSMLQPVPLELGDVLIRHPWALHRGTPNVTDTPRPLVSIRYVRHWYADNSREVNPIPRTVWQGLTTEQQTLMRFAIEN